MRLATGGETDRERFLGGRLANRAGDGDALSGTPIARRFAEFTEAFKNIGHRERGAQAFDLACIRDQCSAGARDERLREEIVTIAYVFQRNEEITGFAGARIDGDAVARP
jgi:hypothetical protein